MAKMAPKPKREPKETAALNLRDIPVEQFYRIKMAAAAERKSVRDLIMALLDGKIRELEKRGLLPKAKS